MSDPRIISLLPAATEMLAAIGLTEHIIGISHECNWPPEVRKRPVLVRPALATDTMTPVQIDAAVSNHFAEGATSLYVIDEEKLAALSPTHIITQDVCGVCAPSGSELEAIVARMNPKPELVSLSPSSLKDIAQNVRDLGDIFGAMAKAEAEILLTEWKARMDEVQARVSAHPRVRCFVMEWVNPIYCSGHWVAEMVQMAGGYDLLARPGQDSIRVPWEEVVAAAPEVLIIAPCGFNLDQASDQLDYLKTLPGWETLPAVQSKRVYAVNADAFITRPGPRIIDGIEMLAHLLHG